jgi:hypothetical protein
MSMSDPLAIYLHDHLGGARLAIEVLESMSDRKNRHPLADFADRLLLDIKADRDTLQTLAKSMGTDSSVFKEVAGWLAEKAARLKLGHTNADAFNTFQTLEFLSLGILGKLALWRALEVVAVSDQRLAGFDFLALSARAKAQQETVEQRRLDLATAAMAPTP